MNVYTCKFTSAYGFCVGFLIVAAKSEEEACHTAMKCKQAYKDSELSGREYERIVKYVDEIKKDNGK